jgi:hypothetical protein
MRISWDGQIPSKECKWFNSLFDFLSQIELPRLEMKRKKIYKDSKPLDWRLPISVNSIDNQKMMILIMLAYMDFLVQEVRSGDHDDLFLRLFGVPITAHDKAEIASWKMHIEDDFFVVNHRPKEGAVFVQCGRLYGREVLNVHEPRVFIVQGNGVPLQSLIDHRVQSFRENQKSIIEDLKDVDICLVHTILLPFNRGITFAFIMGPPMAKYYTSSLDMKKAALMAVNAAKTAMNAESLVPCYRSLNLNDHGHIRRQVSEQENISMRVPEIGQSCDPTGVLSTNCTEITIQQHFWNPTNNHNDPIYKLLIGFACGGIRPFCEKGIESMGNQEAIIEDEDICPFHKQSGYTRCFRECCKTEFLKRKLKATERVNDGWTIVMYEPWDINTTYPEDDCPKRTGFSNPIPSLRLGYGEGGKLCCTVSTESVPALKGRMDVCPRFLAISQYKWLYIGSAPRSLSVLGLMIFGVFELFPSIGIFLGESLTPGRMTFLIRELKIMCEGLSVLRVSLECLPLHKVKPNKETLTQNEALLRDGWSDVEISVTINKKECEGFRVHCGYCGATERSTGTDLLRCSCKVAYYCCKEHQSSHWQDHQKTCLEVRKRSN